MQSANYCDILEASITTDLQFYLFFFNSEKDFHYKCLIPFVSHLNCRMALGWEGPQR